MIKRLEYVIQDFSSIFIDERAKMTEEIEDETKKL